MTAAQPADPGLFLTASDLPYELPPFGEIRIEHLRPALDVGMAEQLAEVDVIALRDVPPTFDNTVVALERSGRVLDRVRRVFWLLTGADTTPELQAIETAYAPKLAAHADAITLNRDLFAWLDELHAARHELGLDDESRRLLERYHLDFVRAGAALDPGDQDRLRAINAELAGLTTEFGVRLLAAATGSAVHVSDPAGLEGLSGDAVSAAAEAAAQRGLDGHLLELVLPTHQPVLVSIRNRALRRRVLDASLGRGSGDGSDTSDLVRRVVAARARRAVLLGYATHADYVLADRTVGSNARLDKTLQLLIPPAVANAHQDADRLARALTADTGATDFGAHDWAYYAERLDAEQEARPDAAALRPYVELTRTLEDGVFGAAGAVYGLGFRRRHDLVGYHPDVVYEVLDAEGDPVGLFLGDFYTRAGKQGGAWMEALVAQNRLLDQRPVVVNNLNLARPAPGQPTLLSMDEVRTLFHEFGHALHGLLSSVTYPRLSGTAVSKDFVEYPSQATRCGLPSRGSWPGTPGTSTPASRSPPAWSPPCRSTTARTPRARRSASSATWIDLAWHRLTESEVDEAVRDIDAFEARALGEVGLDLATIPPRYRSRYFNHIFGGGYAAGYYSYLWSEILDADTVEWFAEHRDRLRQAGDEFAAALLSRGGSGDEMGYFEAFRGRPPRIEPLLRRRGLVTPTT